MSAQTPYNPLDKTNLGESVAQALLRTSVRPLADTANLIGAGVYAIYYTGDFPPYRIIRDANRDERFAMPIYVGKAVPEGARKGGMSVGSSPGTSLRKRLRKHGASVSEAMHLDISEFHFRALVVDDIWIPLGENVLIQKFQPLWNRVIDGFGNNTPGAGRVNGRQSQWDTLHPGRRFVAKLNLPPNPLTEDQIRGRIEDFFSGRLAESDKIDPEDAED